MSEIYTGPWKSERFVCEFCGHVQVSVHPDCERCECSACGRMMQSIPSPREFDAQLPMEPKP